MKVTDDVRLLMKFVYWIAMAIGFGLVAYLLWMTFVTVYNGLIG
ncbi:hypothetical protein HMF8227_01530 [Saliniradius amylolyticus]|uniref:Uncharacterized protein n=1 Tax=Saliniradius amylolyticus TaxID=2183582 RepID=A0A2S2E2Z0_9ALTE|nr:hypothetical protein [Saliniradius amylolyticus]AWL12004.1 hypothetical protein HMF8227_01530 [Saliniradius amylolyticus]